MGGYEEGSNGWRQLHAWVVGQEVEVAPTCDETDEEEVLTTLHGWQESLPTHTDFTLETSEQIISKVYSQRRSLWWSGVGAGNQTYTHDNKPRHMSEEFRRNLWWSGLIPRSW